MSVRAADSYHERDREQMIRTYMPLVQKTVGKMMLYGNGLLERDDMFSLGVIGLIQALDKYDPSKGVRFETFAVNRIRGAILDELRKLSWRPRSLLDKMKRITSVQDRLETAGKEGDYAAIAEELGESEEHIRMVISQFNIGVLLSFDQVAFNNEVSGQSRHELVPDFKCTDPQANLIHNERLALLTRGIENLSERDRLMLALYYQEEMTLKEIGKVLGISEGRVCQIHARALAKLREYIENAG